MLANADSEYPSATASGPSDVELYLRYSPNAAFYLLTWDRHEHKHTCKTWGFPFIYEEDTYFMEADYTIYRVVDGVERQIGTLAGRVVHERSSLGDKLSESLGFSSDVDSMFPGNSAFFVDYDADVYRERGQSLSYRVFATTEHNRPGCVSPFTVWQSTVVADADGDLYPDFVPKERVDAARAPYLSK